MLFAPPAMDANLVSARQFIQPLALSAAAANVIEIKCFILRGRPKTTTITYSKLASSSTLKSICFSERFSETQPVGGNHATS